MSISCIIIEDQAPAQRLLKTYINQVDFLELEGVFSNAIDALQYLNEEQIDLIFLDIHLPKISGIDFLKTLTHSPKIILTTAFSEYALESYEFDVVDYLLKPFSFQRFLKAILKLQHLDFKRENQVSPKKEESSYIFVKSGYEHLKLDINSIVYIKSESDYTELCTSRSKHLTSFSLKYWKDYLEPSKFCQVHKSYIIQIDKIEKVSGNQVHLVGGQIIPIGRAYKDYFIERFIR